MTAAKVARKSLKAVVTFAIALSIAIIACSFVQQLMRDSYFVGSRTTENLGQVQLAAQQVNHSIWNLMHKEQTVQREFCKQHEHALQDSSLRFENFSYVRHDALSPAKGAAGINMSMWVYATDDIVSDGISKHGSWEPKDTAQMMEKLQYVARTYNLAAHEVFFIDIGANVGWFTVQAASLGFSVVAFEATTPNAYALRNTLCGVPLLQSHVALVNKGLGDQMQTCRVVASKNNMGDGHVQCNVDQGADIPEGYFTEFLPYLKGRVAVVKIDVEGYEDKVFKGGQVFMKEMKPKFLVVEFHSRFSGGTTAEEMLMMFHDWGYMIRNEGFDGVIETPDGFKTWAERTDASKHAINLYFTLSD